MRRRNISICKMEEGNLDWRDDIEMPEKNYTSITWSTLIKIICILFLYIGVAFICILYLYTI